MNGEHPDTVPAPPVPSGSYVRFPGQSPDVIEDWESRLAVMQDTQASQRGERQGELRGKYEGMKQMLRYIESLRRQAEARAHFFGGALVAGLVAIIGLWAMTSVAYHHAVWPWEMLSVFGPDTPPPNGGPPNGHPAP